jgi:hypothetical protein
MADFQCLHSVTFQTIKLSITLYWIVHIRIRVQIYSMIQTGLDIITVVVRDSLYQSVNKIFKKVRIFAPDKNVETH